MDEWIDGWMNGWMDGWMDEWMDGWIAEWMGGWMNGYMVTQTGNQLEAPNIRSNLVSPYNMIETFV